jgi:hypothetical protein
MLLHFLDKYVNASLLKRLADIGFESLYYPKFLYYIPGAMKRYSYVGQ